MPNPWPLNWPCLRLDSIIQTSACLTGLVRREHSPVFSVFPFQELLDTLRLEKRVANRLNLDDVQFSQKPRPMLRKSLRIILFSEYVLKDLKC